MSLNNMEFSSLPDIHKGIAKHSSCDLEQIFNQCFLGDYATVLTGGWPEPFYLPSGWSLDSLEKDDRIRIESSGIDTNNLSLLCYRSNFFASALHEVAHWCIAGESRRKQCDFGYWYVPECRDANQQNEFLSVEVRPQALELLFAIVCDYPFRVSFDNPVLDDGSPGIVEIRSGFTGKVIDAALEFIEGAIPSRANRFMSALGDYYGNSTSTVSVRERIERYADKFRITDSRFERLS